MGHGLSLAWLVTWLKRYVSDTSLDPTGEGIPFGGPSSMVLSAFKALTMQQLKNKYLGKDGYSCLKKEAGSRKQQGITVSPTTKHSATQKTTFREVFLKPQIWKKSQEEVQSGLTTLSEMSCFTLPSYTVMCSGEIYTLNYALCLDNFLIPLWRCREGQDKWFRLLMTDSKPFAFKTKPKGCATKCTPSESLQTSVGHITSGDVGLDFECLKISPKVNFSRHWLPQMGQDQLRPQLGCWDLG